MQLDTEPMVLILLLVLFLRGNPWAGNKQKSMVMRILHKERTLVDLHSYMLLSITKRESRDYDTMVWLYFVQKIRSKRM